MDADDAFVGFLIFLVIAGWFALIIGLAAAVGSKPYCPVGQGTVLDSNSNVTGCVILVPQPVPTLVPGQIVPPLTKD